MGSGNDDRGIVTLSFSNVYQYYKLSLWFCLQNFHTRNTIIGNNHDITGILLLQLQPLCTTATAAVAAAAASAFTG